MSNELKPCPFCGNVNVVAEVDTINLRFHQENEFENTRKTEKTEVENGTE